MSLKLDALIERGYFPQELPPTFTTSSLSTFLKTTSSAAFSTIKHKKTIAGNTPSKCSRYNLARAGTLRRELSVPNPIHFSQLAEFVTKHWADLSQHTTSNISLSSPQISTGYRALDRKTGLDELPGRKVSTRSLGKYILQADIERCYATIYTHSIPWAIHGKDVAKRNHSLTLYGNKLDELVRNCQDGQTIGIPVGPDTSLLIAEVILSKVDRLLSQKRYKGYRYVDDFELAFDTEERAQRALEFLQQFLLDFELHLNPGKTKLVSLPQSLTDDSKFILREAPLDPASGSFRSQLYSFFDTAFRLAKENPTYHMLNYAAGRVCKLNSPANSGMIEDLLIQSARCEPGTLPFLLKYILTRSGQSQDRSKTRHHLFERLILENAPQGHSSEVAWSIWACIALGFEISAASCKEIVNMGDSFCALLALHARSLNLVKNPRLLDSMSSVLTSENLYDRNWLLAYEAELKGWLTSPTTPSHVDSDANFSRLKAAGVSFYDSTMTAFPDVEDKELRDFYLSRMTVTDYSQDPWEHEEDDDDDALPLF